MASVPGRTKYLESAASIAVIFILLAVAGVILNRESRFDMTRFGILGGETKTSESLPGDSQKTQIAEASLASFATADLTPQGSTDAYNADNLYEKIDGKAPLYVESGFVQLRTQRFDAVKKPDISFELYLYDMANARNAFSVYSRQKRADATVLPDFPFIYNTTNSVYLSYGKYYVELVGFAESQELIEMLRTFARKLAGTLTIDVNDAAIGELGFFPQQNLVAGSAKLHLKNAFGFDGLTDTFTAVCKIDNQTVTVFFGKYQSTDEARRVAQSYCDFLIANGAKDKNPAGETLRQLKAGIFDLYGTIEIVFATGPFVAGIHEADDTTIAEKAAEVLLNRLNEVTGEKSDAAK